MTSEYPLTASALVPPNYHRYTLVLRDGLFHHAAVDNKTYANIEPGVHWFSVTDPMSKDDPNPPNDQGLLQLRFEEGKVYIMGMVLPGCWNSMYGIQVNWVRVYKELELKKGDSLQIQREEGRGQNYRGLVSLQCHDENGEIVAEAVERGEFEDESELKTMMRTRRARIDARKVRRAGRVIEDN